MSNLSGSVQDQPGPEDLSSGYILGCDYLYRLEMGFKGSSACEVVRVFHLFGLK